MDLKKRIEKLEGKAKPDQDKWKNVRVVIGEAEALEARKELKAQGIEGVIIQVVSKRAKELTERLLNGEGT